MADRKFTGKGVTVTIAGVPVGIADLKLNMKRNTITQPRAGKESPIQYPGALIVSGSLTGLYLKGALLAKIMNTTIMNSTAQPIVTAGASLNAAGLLTLAGTNAGNGFLQATFGGTTSTTTTKLTIAGINVAGGDAADFIIIPAGTTAGTTFLSHFPFATMSPGGIANTVAAGTGATIGIASVAGQASITLGRPAFFGFTGGAVSEDGVGNVNATANNIWFDDASLNIGDTDKWVPQPLSFKVMDADADLSVTYAD